MPYPTMTDAKIKLLQEVAEWLYPYFPEDRWFLTGSAARGTETDSSDVDVSIISMRSNWPSDLNYLRILREKAHCERKKYSIKLVACDQLVAVSRYVVRWSKLGSAISLAYNPLHELKVEASNEIGALSKLKVLKLLSCDRDSFIMLKNPSFKEMAAIEWRIRFAAPIISLDLNERPNQAQYADRINHLLSQCASLERRFPELYTGGPKENRLLEDSVPVCIAIDTHLANLGCEE